VFSVQVSVFGAAPEIEERIDLKRNRSYANDKTNRISIKEYRMSKKCFLSLF